MGRASSMNGGEQECVEDIDGKSRKERKPLGRPRHRWVGNIKMDLKER
jgi:hypothetical protein